MKNIRKFILKKVASKELSSEEAKVLLDEISSANKYTETNDEIAVIGMSCKFPQANNLKEFWENLKTGKGSIRKFPESRKKDTDIFLPEEYLEDDERYQREGFLDKIDEFDAAFFGLTPKEARLMSPLQRFFLEASWEAIENAGLGGAQLVGSNTGVFVGKSHATDFLYKEFIKDFDTTAFTGSISGILSSRISYLLNLRGPSMVVDTACSSGLLAIDVAAQYLKRGECDVALAGGINLSLFPLKWGKATSMIQSSSNVIRAFEKNSSGTLWGEGVGVVVLKPLKKALNDGDNIYGVIKAISSNQDGASNGITAPNRDAQEKLLEKVWKEARVNPETITYIESHGTGTNLGDPIEVGALSNVFARYTNKKQFCALSSIKPNIGHLGGASGIASFIKVILALQNKQLPPTIYFQEPNPFIDFEKSALYLIDQLKNWDEKEQPHTAAVSSFGFSGTNVHAIVQEAPKNEEKTTEVTGPLLLVLSAKNEKILKDLITLYKEYLNENKSVNLNNLCFTAATGRGHYEHRLAIFFNGYDELKQIINVISTSNFKKTNLSNVFYGNYKLITADKTETQPGDITEGEKRKLSKQANEISSMNTDVLKELANFYVKGAEVNWNKVYKDKKYKRIPLPTYPFERKRQWVKPYLRFKIGSTSSTQFFHSLNWKEATFSKNSKELTDKNVLLFAGKNKISEQITLELNKLNVNVIKVLPDDHFKKINDNEYKLGNSIKDYENLLQSLKTKNISLILNTANVFPDEKSKIEPLTVKEGLNSTLYFLLYLAHSYSNFPLNNKVKLVLITDYANSVTENNKTIKPLNHAFFALGRVLQNEFSGIALTCIDVDEHFTPTDFIKELNEKTNVYKTIAYRNNKRFQAVYENRSLKNLSDEKVNLKNNDTYIIVGGTGGLGLEMAQYFTSKKKVKLVILSRSGFIPESNWSKIIKENKDKSLIKKIKTFRQMIAAGNEISFYKADIANNDEMKTIIKQIKDKYGAINGVIHCAGVAGESLMIRKTKEDFEQKISAKILGTALLTHLLKDEPFKFFVLFSSIVSFSGFAGQSDYTTSNAYLDAFAQNQALSGKKFLSINWVPWKETGMAVEYGTNVDTHFKAITTENALKNFEKAFHKKIACITIGEINEAFLNSIKDESKYPLPYSQKILGKLNKNVDIEEKNMGNEPKKVQLKGKTGSEYDEIEKQIATIWAKVLEYDEIDIYDNFFELGGNSIMITKIHEQLDNLYPGKLAIAELFDYPTISKLANYIKEKDKTVIPEEKTKETSKQNEGDISKMFSEMKKGNMSLDDMLENLDE